MSTARWCRTIRPVHDSNTLDGLLGADFCATIARGAPTEFFGERYSE